MCKPWTGACEGSSARAGRRLCPRSGEGAWLADGCVCPWDLSALLQAQQRRKGTHRRGRHVAASQKLVRVILLREGRMSAAGQMLLPHCRTWYRSVQTLQAVAGATARCVPSAQVTRCPFGCRHMKQTGTRGLVWRPPCSECPLPG